MYNTELSTMGNPNLMNNKLKQSKFFSISKAKRDFNWKAGEGADSGKYHTTVGEISKSFSRRDGGKGAAWGKAKRQ